jgi:hypothetical protein
MRTIIKDIFWLVLFFFLIIYFIIRIINEGPLPLIEDPVDYLSPLFIPIMGLPFFIIAFFVILHSILSSLNNK